jgi:hypothetical protein
VQPGTPDAVMAQTGTEKKKKKKNFISMTHAEVGEVVA